LGDPSEYSDDEKTKKTKAQIRGELESIQVQRNLLYIPQGFLEGQLHKSDFLAFRDLEYAEEFIRDQNDVKTNYKGIFFLRNKGS
jgi:hypothetical protein